MLSSPSADLFFFFFFFFSSTIARPVEGEHPSFHLLQLVPVKRVHYFFTDSAGPLTSHACILPAYSSYGLFIVGEKDVSVQACSDIPGTIELNILV